MILKFSKKFDHPFLHIFIFGNMFPGSHGFVAMPVTSCFKDAHSKFIFIKSVKEDKILWLCDEHSNETMTLRKHVTKYKDMRKWMMKFLRKFVNRGIKMAQVNSILTTKSIKLQLFTLILYSFGGPL